MSEVTLTEAERSEIRDVLSLCRGWGERRKDFRERIADRIIRDFEQILAARLVESDKAGYERGWDAAVSEFRVNEPMRSDHPAIAAREAENARLRDTLARVKALADDMKGEHGQSWNSISGQRILNALAGGAQ